MHMQQNIQPNALAPSEQSHPGPHTDTLMQLRLNHAHVITAGLRAAVMGRIPFRSQLQKSCSKCTAAGIEFNN